MGNKGSTHRLARLALVAALLLTPAVGASWSAGGNLEPDTSYDVEAGRMWTTPDTDPDPTVRKVYFNAVIVGSNGVNPNLGALGSRVIAPTISAQAWLGLWKDCNADGYIGHVETLLLEYVDALLTDTTICPPNSDWNHHGWVSEFIHIANRSAHTSPTQFPRILRDTEVRVWGDFKRPDMTPDPAVSCLNAPLNRGTLDSTGAILLVVDCNTNYNVARTVNEVDALFPLGLRFDGEGGHYRPDNDCDHPLNVQLDMYGDSPCNDDDPGLFESSTGHRMFDVWDCAAKGQEKFLDVRDPTAPSGRRGQFSYIPDPQTGEPLLFITDSDGTYGTQFIVLGGGIYAQIDNGNPPAPGVNDTDGSLSDTATHTSDGMGPCTGGEADDGLGEPITNGDLVLDPLSGKRNQDFTLLFRAGNATGTLGTLNNFCLSGVCLSSAAAPENDGVRGTSAPYRSNESYGPPNQFPNGVVRRDNLQPTGSTWFTFYARVGSDTLASGAQLRDASTSRYGAAACGAHTSGVHAGWDCERTHWYAPLLGGDANARFGQVPGAEYQLFDVDCYDGSVGGGTGLFVGPATLSSDPPCPPVP